MLSDCQVLPWASPGSTSPSLPRASLCKPTLSSRVLFPAKWDGDPPCGQTVQPPRCSPGTRNLGLGLEGRSSPRRSCVPAPPTPCPCWWLLGPGCLNCWSPINGLPHPLLPFALP